MGKVAGGILDKTVQEVVAVFLDRYNPDAPFLGHLYILFSKRRAGLIDIGHETAKLNLGLSTIIHTVHPQFKGGLNEIYADDHVRLDAGAGRDHGRERAIGGFQKKVLERAADIHDLKMAAIVGILGPRLQQRWRELHGCRLWKPGS